MLKIVVLALAFGIVAAIPIPDPVGLGMGGAITTSHHSTATASHHPMGLGMGMGYSFGAYPVSKHMHTETVASHSAAYPGAASSLSHYGAHYGYPGLGALSYGFPSQKQITHVTTTAVRPGYFGYY